jgi:hypothetical protein
MCGFLKSFAILSYSLEAMFSQLLAAAAEIG